MTGSHPSADGGELMGLSRDKGSPLDLPSPLVDGVPLDEFEEITLLPCGVCGEPANEHVGGVMSRLWMDGGKAFASTVCRRCLAAQGILEPEA